MNYSLLLFYHGSVRELFLLLFAENLILAVLAVVMGILLLKTLGKSFEMPNKRERKFFYLTVLINTIITYLGFSFWDIGLIHIRLAFDSSVITDFIFTVLIMDLLTWLFHFILHRKPFFEKIHHVSHSSENINPASLFVIHPAEALMLGFLWISVLVCFSLNIYSIILFLVFHVILGIIAHLGISIPAPKNSILKIFISPAFRLEHQKCISMNFGFYTKIWDNLFKTLSAPYTNFAKDTL